MRSELTNFIKENKNLINQNTKESWEAIYKQAPWQIIGEFTQVILDAEINDPAEIMGKIPGHYLRDSNIQNYIIPDNVVGIGRVGFGGCSNLTSIVLPNNVTYIDPQAFGYCSSLTNIVIPDNVTFIGYKAFAYCTSLTSVIIGNRVTEIVAGAFEHCINLTSVEIKSTYLTSIGEGIFKSCLRLREIHYDGPMKPELVKLKGKRKGLKIICTDGIM